MYFVGGLVFVALYVVLCFVVSSRGGSSTVDILGLIPVGKGVTGFSVNSSVLFIAGWAFFSRSASLSWRVGFWILYGAI